MPSHVFALGSDIPTTEPSTDATLPEALQGKRFALFVSTIEPRKNHRVLYEAWDRCMRSKTLDPTRDRLVFVGRRGWAADDLLREIAANPVTRDTILLLDRVTDAELATLYRQCALVLFPSFYEGLRHPGCRGAEPRQVLPQQQCGLAPRDRHRPRDAPRPKGHDRLGPGDRTLPRFPQRMRHLGAPHQAGTPARHVGRLRSAVLRHDREDRIVTIRRVLGLGTYPVVKPIHGGQRRVDAIARFYRSIGIEHIHACIYDSAAYRPPLVGPHDIPLVATTGEFGPIGLTGDLLSGLQGETDAATRAHFANVVERIAPDALQLEHPFMWPLAKRLRDRAGVRLPVIYSSHNVEAPLKQSILASAGMSKDLSRRVYETIDHMEADLCREAALVVCVTASDGDSYRRHNPSITVVPNGVDRPPTTIRPNDAVRAAFGDNRFLFMVGSDYVPNIEGFCDYVARDGMFFCPPVKSVAVCGGVAAGIRAHAEFRRFLPANSARTEFFPVIDDDALWAVKEACHAVMLPILTGGGSNLKAAEALTLGKWVVATPMALRGFEAFMDAEGVILANDRHAFRRALAQTLHKPPLRISDAARKARDTLYWDALLANSPLAGELARL